MNGGRGGGRNGLRTGGRYGTRLTTEAGVTSNVSSVVTGGCAVTGAGVTGFETTAGAETVTGVAESEGNPNGFVTSRLRSETANGLEIRWRPVTRSAAKASLAKATDTASRAAYRIR